MSIGDMTYSIAFYSRKFVSRYKKQGTTQHEIDIILLDFINYFSAMHEINLIMHNRDLRHFKRMYDDSALSDMDSVRTILNNAIESYKQEPILEKLTTMYEKTFNCRENIIYSIVDDFARGYLNNQAHRLGLDITDARARKNQEIYIARESTIKHLLAILAIEIMSKPTDKIKIENLVISTGFISLETFELGTKVRPKKFHSIFGSCGRYQIREIKRKFRYIKVMSQYEQKEKLTEILKFMRVNKFSKKI